jgi:hypothetical protein
MAEKWAKNSQKKRRKIQKNDRESSKPTKIDLKLTQFAIK